MQKIDLVIIDPQHDFCNPDGALFVPGANKDMDRLTTFIDRVSKKLNDIHVTLDTHHYVDIAHPVFWKDSGGAHPQPFTIISKDDVKSGKWTTSQPSCYRRALEYVLQLEKNGRYPLCVWPPHCLIGSRGHSIYEPLFKKLLEWETGFSMVDYVTKGSNLWTEHYSALQADVPDPADPTTQINTGFINTLMEADYVVIAGEAGSHCLANSVRDIANNAPDDFVKKIVLLEDATSPVPTFETLQDDFIKEMVGRGMRLSTTTSFLA